MGEHLEESEAEDYIRKHPKMQASKLLRAALAEVRALRGLRATVEIALDELAAEELPAAEALEKLTNRLQGGFDPDLE